MEEMAGIGHCTDSRNGGNGSIHNGKRHFERSQRHKLISIKAACLKQTAILHYFDISEGSPEKLAFYTINELVELVPVVY